jgi:predicted permease
MHFSISLKEPHRMFRRFLNLFRPNSLDAEIREELEFHQAQTRGRFGNPTLIQEQAREASTIVWLETLVQDVRYGWRQLLKARALTTIAVLSLALGIGANTAIFTLINAVMLQRLPVKDPGSLVLFYDGIDTGVYSGTTFARSDLFSYADWENFRAHNEVFESLSAFRQGRDPLVMHRSGSAEAGPKERASGHLVSGNYFEVLGVPAAAGRLLIAQDDRLAATPVAVISHGYWRRRFHLDPSAVGKTVDLNGTAFTIVGVAAPEFFGERVERPPDFWLPLARQADILQRESWQPKTDVYWLNLIGRLKPGVTLKQAELAVNTRLQQFYQAQLGTHLTPERRRQLQQVHIELKPGARGISAMRVLYSEPLHVLMAVVGLVLLVACANVATLLLSRASARRPELFARLSLGASRTRLMRQLLTESILLALLGGAIGVTLAWWSVKALGSMVGVPDVVDLKPDLLVLSFTLAVSILTGIGFGLIPALRASKLEWRANSGLRSQEFGMSRMNAAHAFVVIQVALCSVLLVAAALLTHSLIGLQQQQLGFSRENVLLVRTDAKLAGYEPDGLLALNRQLYEKLNAVPGVVSATVAAHSPLSGSSNSTDVSIEGSAPRAGRSPTLFMVDVGPRFFDTLGIPLLQGRAIGPRDTPGSPGVAVVNETFVREFLPNQNPIGRYLSLGRPFRAPGIEIIGVVADSRYYKVSEAPKAMAFFAAWQAVGRGAYSGELLIRTSQDVSGAAADVRRAIREVDDKLPILGMTTLGDQTWDSLRQQRMFSFLCGVFGVLALALASIGLYGTMAYSVVRRTNEIGVRMALGAEQVHVLWMMLRESVVLVAIGLACGLPLAIGAARFLESFLFGVAPFDPAGIGVAMLVLTATAAIAGYLPARRATRVDPIEALKYE